MSNALNIKVCETLCRGEWPLTSLLFGLKQKGDVSKTPYFQTLTPSLLLNLQKTISSSGHFEKELLYDCSALQKPLDQ